MTLDIKDEDCEIPMTANENPLQLIQILYQNLSKISGPYVINFHDEDLSDYKETNSCVASGHQLTPTAHNPSRTMLHDSVALNMASFTFQLFLIMNMEMKSTD